MREIKIKSFNGIGDLLFATPTLSRIKEHYPDSHITVNTNHPDLLDRNPHVDAVNTGKDGVFLGYADPIHRKDPVKHHIMADWEIICREHDIKTMPPMLKPEIYLPASKYREGIGVQVMHKGHWGNKKVWDKFDALAEEEGFSAIPRVASVRELVHIVSSYRVVVCAEGGISHIARAMDIPAVVVYGGFANPVWNGYNVQWNICNTKECSYCYNPDKCVHTVDRYCMKQITMARVMKAAKFMEKSHYE